MFRKWQSVANGKYSIAKNDRCECSQPLKNIYLYIFLIKIVDNKCWWMWRNTRIADRNYFGKQFGKFLKS